VDSDSLPSVLVVGGGFGGLAAARALEGAPANVTVIDRRNHHLFQPLLYQVATAALSPADIAAPIRTTLREAARCRVALAEVTGIDTADRRLEFDEGSAPYDYLVLAAGAGLEYFGNDSWREHAPGLKSLEDATEVRRRILLAFESAEHEGDEEARRAELTFAIVGGGPTGVELAGAIKEIAGKTLSREYRSLDSTTTRVILIQAEDRLLTGFPDSLSERAKRDLERLGVEVHLGKLVTEIEIDGLRIGDEFIAARNTFWAAGVSPSPLAAALGAPTDDAGRVVVGPDLSVPGLPEVFVVGDTASFTSKDSEEALPGVAQVAMQMGRHAGRVIRRDIETGSRDGRPAFRYNDKGSMAIIGKNRAVARIGRAKFTGFIAWVVWAVVHLTFLVGFRNRIRVLFSWFTKWLTNSHDARLVLGDAKLRVNRLSGGGFRRRGSEDCAEHGTEE